MENQKADIHLDLTIEEMKEVCLSLTYGTWVWDKKYRLANQLLENFNTVRLFRIWAYNFMSSKVFGGKNTDENARYISSNVVEGVAALFKSALNEIPNSKLRLLSRYIMLGEGPLMCNYLSDSGASHNSLGGLTLEPELENLAKGLSACINLKDVTMPTIFLWGPPGTGKSSFATGVCEDVGVSVSRITINNLIENLRVKVPAEFDGESLVNGEVLVVDEVDKLPPNILEENLVNLLAFLDSKPKDLLIILTSNKPPDEFPGPFLRSGRVDIIRKIDYLPEELAFKLISKLLPKCIAEKAFNAYKEYNGYPTSYQPAAIKAFSDNVKRQAVIGLISQGIDLPEGKTKKITFMRNFNAAVKQLDGAKNSPKKGGNTSLLRLFKSAMW